MGLCDTPLQNAFDGQIAWPRDDGNWQKTIRKTYDGYDTRCSLVACQTTLTADKQKTKWNTRYLRRTISASCDTIFASSSSSSRRHPHNMVSAGPPFVIDFRATRTPARFRGSWPSRVPEIARGLGFPDRFGLCEYSFSSPKIHAGTSERRPPLPRSVSKVRAWRHQGYFQSGVRKTEGLFGTLKYRFSCDTTVMNAKSAFGIIICCLTVDTVVLAIFLIKISVFEKERASIVPIGSVRKRS